MIILNCPKYIYYAGIPAQTEEKMKKFAKDFKEFIAKGNVMDMAVAVIIGAAFGKIVTSLVNDIIMPLISKLFGAATFADLKTVLVEATEDKEAVTLNYGAFIQNIVDFLLIAIVIFIVLKAFMKMKKKFEKPEEPKEEEAPAETELDVLKEIRDSLANGRNNE